MHLLAQLSTSHLFTAGLLATSALILFQTNRRWQRAASSKSSTRSPEPRRKSHEVKPVETGTWEVQMHEYARDVTARIDSKMAALEHLMRAAHLETERLESAIARAEAAGVLEAAEE